MLTPVALHCWIIADDKILAYLTQNESIINPGNYRGKVSIIKIALSEILGPGGLSDVPEITVNML